MDSHLHQMREPRLRRYSGSNGVRSIRRATATVWSLLGPPLVALHGCSAPVTVDRPGSRDDGERSESAVVELASPVTATGLALSRPLPSSKGSGGRATIGGWYGWQVLAADTLSLGTLTLGLSMHNGYLSLMGLVGHAPCGPTVHLLHRNPNSALRSLNYRVGFTAAGGLFGLIASKFSKSISLEERVLRGALFGMVVASLADAALLAYEDEPAPAKAVRWGPVVAPTGDGGWAGLQGWF